MNLPDCSGISFKNMICVGDHFSREDIKEQLFAQGFSFCKEAVFTLEDLCCKILGISKKDILDFFARQEIYKLLLYDPRIKPLNLFHQLKRRGNFLKILDSSLQESRYLFAHPDEKQVLLERLEEVIGGCELKRQFAAFDAAFDAYLLERHFFDPPLLLRCAREKIKAHHVPAKIWYVSLARPLANEKIFWQTVQENTDLIHFPTLQSPPQAPLPCWLHFHTYDDAAEYIAEQLATQQIAHQTAILIPDIPSMRRTLKRALEKYHVDLFDHKDPTYLKEDEQLKFLLLPLYVISSNFRETYVTAWVQSQKKYTWVRDIYQKGCYQGLQNYAAIPELYEALVALKNKFVHACTWESFSQIFLNTCYDAVQNFSLEQWYPTLCLLKAVCERYQADLCRIGREHKKGYLPFWLKGLEERLAYHVPFVPPVHLASGVRLYRFGQASVLDFEMVYVIGLPADYLSGLEEGNMWFCDRSKEILAHEFETKNFLDQKQEKLRLFEHWLNTAKNVVFCDATFDWSGKKQDSLEVFFIELQKFFEWKQPVEKKNYGIHPVFEYSWYEKQAPVKKFSLPPLALKSLSASQVEAFSRCPFQELAFFRWKLENLKRPGREAWKRSQGKVLQDLSNNLLRMDEKHVDTFLREKMKDLEGMFQQEKCLSAQTQKFKTILDIFFSQEKEFQKKELTQTLLLDNRTFFLQIDDIQIVARPDRLELTSNKECFFIEYKASHSVPTGKQILEHGYRLQLAVYALIAEQYFNGLLAGLQYVVLTTTGHRTNGIFLKPWNHKKGLTSIRANSHSLVDMPANVLIHELKMHVKKAAHQIIKGQYAAQPNVAVGSKECYLCQVKDLCGKNR